MRGLVKGAEEIPETAWTGFIRTHLELMHTQEPLGNGYALAEDYAEGYEWIITVRDGLLYAGRGSPKTETTETPTEASETVTTTSEATTTETDEPSITIDGKTYTMSELSDLVNKQ